MTEAIESYPTLLVCVALDEYNEHKRVLLITQCKYRTKNASRFPTQSKALCQTVC